MSLISRCKRQIDRGAASRVPASAQTGGKLQQRRTSKNNKQTCQAQRAMWVKVGSKLLDAPRRGSKRTQHTQHQPPQSARGAACRWYCLVVLLPLVCVLYVLFLDSLGSAAVPRSHSSLFVAAATARCKQDGAQWQRVAANRAQRAQRHLSKRMHASNAYTRM